MEQYSADGTLIKVWSSAIAAAEHYGVVPSTIRSACLSNAKKYKGFEWKYANDESI